MTRKRITYPNAEHPECTGECFYDDEADPDVVYLHYVDFRRPGKAPFNETVAVEKSTGIQRIVKDTPPDFSKFAN